MDFSRNILHFRKKNNISLTQAAAALGVGTDFLAGLESGRIQPDAALLPSLAQLYRVTIDDLFSRRSIAYDNHAQRLAALFDSTQAPQDFALAEEAFRQLMEQGRATTEDLRIYAQLHQTMMNYCLEQCLALYKRISWTGDEASPTLHAARRQHMHLLLRIGQSTPELEAYLTELRANCANPEEWLALISAFQDAGRPEDALQWLNAARERFPKNAMFCYWGGTICQALDRWTEALQYWQALLAMDPDFTDAAYGCAECREKLGDLDSAGRIWEELARRLENQGLTAEAIYPKEQARHCRAQMGRAFT